MLNPTSAPCDERLFPLSRLGCNASWVASSKRNVHVPSTLCYGAKSAQDTPLPLPPLVRLSQVSMDTPGHYSWLIGYGWEAVATDPNGEVHLKELIYLQITFPKFLFY